MLPLPDEHLGLGKWLHSALLRREKRILWLQTTLSVNILQLSVRLSDDKPHAARRAANLRPYGHHFIVIFHGRNVNGRCLPQPPLAAPLSTLKRGRGGPRPAGLISPPTRARSGLALHRVWLTGVQRGRWELCRHFHSVRSGSRQPTQSQRRQVGRPIRLPPCPGQEATRREGQRPGAPAAGPDSWACAQLSRWLGAQTEGHMERPPVGSCVEASGPREHSL